MRSGSRLCLLGLTLFTSDVARGHYAGIQTVHGSITSFSERRLMLSHERSTSQPTQPCRPTDVGHASALQLFTASEPQQRCLCMHRISDDATVVHASIRAGVASLLLHCCTITCSIASRVSACGACRCYCAPYSSESSLSNQQHVHIDTCRQLRLNTRR